MSEQMIFKDVLDEGKINDKLFRDSFTLIGTNKLLREQVADADSMIEEILCSLNYGPDNELVRQAIDIYNNKWYGSK